MSETKQEQLERLSELLEEELAKHKRSFVLIVVEHDDQKGGTHAFGSSNIPVEGALYVLDVYTASLRSRTKIEGEGDREAGHA